MKQVLLDTSIIIDFLRRRDKQNSALVKLVDQKKKLAVSIRTHTELYAGKSVWEHTKAQKELEIIFKPMEIKPISQSISRKAGQLIAINNLELVDALIASSALYYKLPLATLNLKDFRKVLGLTLLKI